MNTQNQIESLLTHFIVKINKRVHLLILHPPQKDPEKIRGAANLLLTGGGGGGGGVIFSFVTIVIIIKADIQ